MNVDCVFNSLLYLNINNISNILLTCKYINSINTQYFWKLLCKRNYKLEYNKFTEKTYYDIYKLCKQLTNLTNKLSLNLMPYELYTIEKLDCSDKNLFYFPNELCTLINLRELYLDNNKLESLSDNICNLTNLKELHLVGNKLTSISKEISRMTNLTLLDLCDNKLTEVPIELSKMKNLKELSLEVNNIEWIPSKLLKIKKFYI